MTTRDEDVQAVRKAATADWAASLTALPKDYEWPDFKRAEAAIHLALLHERQRTLETALTQPSLSHIRRMLSEVQAEIASLDGSVPLAP